LRIIIYKSFDYSKLASEIVVFFCNKIISLA